MRFTTLAATAALLASSAFAGNGTIVVNSFLDLPDPNLSDGTPDADLETEGEQITLRSAIMHAKAIGGSVTIELQAGVYKLTRKSKESADDVGDLDIDVDMVIEGAGPLDTIIDARKAKDRVFDIDFGADVAIRNVTITRGKPPFGGGGGIRVFDSSLTLSNVIVTKNRTKEVGTDGGGIEVEDGSLTLFDCYIVKNRARDDAGGVDVDSSTFVAENSTFEKNSAKGEGGAFEIDTGSGTFENCTFSKNRAKTQGGAINNEEGGDVTLRSCSFVLNNAKADTALGGQDFGPNTFTITNSIFLGKGKKRPLNAGGVITSGGGNIESGDSMGFSAPADLVNTDPRVDKKARENGVHIRTHLLREDSPAIDFAVESECTSSDQNGMPRVDIFGVGGKSICDSGAAEFVPEDLGGEG